MTSDLTSCCFLLFLLSPRFFEDLKDMLGFTPYRFYYYMWKFITPILMLVLLGSSVIQLIMTPPSYSAWIQEDVSPAQLYWDQRSGEGGGLRRREQV